MGRIVVIPKHISNERFLCFMESLERGEIKKSEGTGVIVRYEGPEDGPDMPRMVQKTCIPGLF